MFKIGDYSRLTGVSVKTLHHYDDIGLLKPVRIDRVNGYRYYSFDQLPRLNRILALKDLGFSLEQIARILDDDLTVEQLSGMLILRKVELAQQIEEAQERLARVEARLNQIKQEGKMSDYEIVVKSVDRVKIASARKVVPSPERMRQECQALVDDVCTVLDSYSIQNAGVCLALYHDHTAEGIDVEMAFFVPDDVSQVPGVRELPAVETMATAVYRGSYDDFAAVGQLHADMGKWIESNGYQVDGPSREIYVQTPQSPGGSGIMEIQFPVKKL